MKLLKSLFLILLSFKMLFSYELYDNRVEDRVWKSGETLLEFLQENLLPLRLYYDLDSEDEKLASDIRSGTLYHILRDNNYEVTQALIPLNEELQLHIVRDENSSYSMSVVPILYQTKDEVLNIEFEDIFSKDIVKKSGNFNLSIELEQIFKGSIDFTKLKVGDKLVVLYKQKIRLGKFYGTQEVKAAMIESRRKRHYLFAHKSGAYYDDRARSTDTDSFIVPVKYKRVSSRFTKKRWHPILKKYRAHHGVDYTGPIGTPIKAAYDGKVIFMGNKGGYGKTVIIRHKGGYKTLYAHLNGFNERVRSKRVKKGTVIAYLGNTGRSTGPHLHFGLSLNDRWINPESKIVIRDGLKGAEKREFLKVVKEYKSKIESLLKGDFDG